MQESDFLLKYFSDKFVSINRCLNYLFVRRQTSCIILEVSGHPKYFIFLFDFFNEEISNTLIIFFIRCGISAIKRLVPLLLDEVLNF